MSDNNTTRLSADQYPSLFIAYYSLNLIIVGTLLNTVTFVVLCRPTFRNTDKRPTLHYMRAIAIFDILMLYGWNLDHYLSIIHGFTLQRYLIVTCKFSSFLNFFTVQTSSWLRVFISLERYLSLSRLYRTWFSHSSSVLTIILCIIVLLSLLNLHFFLFSCFYNTDGSINMNSPFYTIYPLWNNINLVVYNGIPFILMIIFNSGVTYHLIRLRRTSTVDHTRIQHCAISFTLLLNTILFLIMTMPSVIGFGFFHTTTSETVLYTFDAILYTYHITSFPLYFMTYEDFRHEFIKMVTCNKYFKQFLRKSPTLPRSPGGSEMIMLRTINVYQCMPQQLASELNNDQV